MVGDKRTTHLHIRISPERKAVYAQAAARDGVKKLTDWVLGALDQVASPTEEKKND